MVFSEKSKRNDAKWPNRVYAVSDRDNHVQVMVLDRLIGKSNLHFLQSAFLGELSAGINIADVP